MRKIKMKLKLSSIMMIVLVAGTCGQYAQAAQQHTTLSLEDVGSIITEEMFEEMLPKRNNPCNTQGFYAYEAFIAAASAFPGFGSTGTLEIRKRELAAFFGQTSELTTGAPASGADKYIWGYCYVNSTYQADFCKESLEWPCVPGQQYYGRGPIQISYNYNYGPAGEALGVDLLSNPGLVATYATLSFEAAIWFWMTPQGNKPSCHDVIIGAWTPSADDVAANRLPGYGVITNIINGNVCGRGYDNRVADGIGYFKRYCDMLDVTPGDNLDCYDQIPFAVGLTAKHNIPRSSMYGRAFLGMSLDRPYFI